MFVRFKDNHNYFILAKDFEYGQTCVLVHNARYGPDTADQRALRELIDETSNKGHKPLSTDNANTLMDMAEEVGFRVRASANDLKPINNHWKRGPHIHIDEKHIPVATPTTIKPRTDI